MRKSLTVLTVATAVLVGATAGTAPATTRRAEAKPAKTVVIKTRKLPKLGYVLVDSRGRTLYMFVPDKRKKVTCVHACAAIWPPVKLAKGAKAIARGRAKQKLLGSDPNPTGGRVVTYARWPLYTYITDTKPGMATGQALDLNGGLWYVIAPSGKIIRTKL